MGHDEAEAVVPFSVGGIAVAALVEDGFEHFMEEDFRDVPGSGSANNDGLLQQVPFSVRSIGVEADGIWLSADIYLFGEFHVIVPPDGSSDVSGTHIQTGSPDALAKDLV